jgi:hypothetical protein
MPSPLTRRLLAALLATGVSGVWGASTGCSARLRALPASIEVSPDHLAFSPGAVGSTQELRVQITNGGSATLSITSVKVAADPNGELAIADVLATDCAGKPRSSATTLLTGECAQVAVRWTPAAAHEAQGSIEVDSDDLQTPSVVLPVSGSGVAPALQICVLAPDGSVVTAACSTRGAGLQSIPTVGFGTGLQGQKLTRSVRLFNRGTSALHLSPAPRLAPGTPADYVLGALAASVIAPGASADLPLSVTPSSNGSLHGTLELLTDDALAADVKVPLLVVVNGWKLCVDPDAGLAFGSLNVGQQQTLTETFSNCGNVDFDLTSFAFVPVSPTAAQFTVPAAQLPRLPLTMKPGAKLPLDVTYAPTLAQADRASFDLRLVVQGGPTLQDSWPVTGAGLSAGCPAKPVAKINAYRNGGTTPINPLTARLTPLDTITLSGASSTVSGSPQYLWQANSEPAGANDPLVGSGVQVKIQVRQVGDYQLSLVVKDAQGCASAPASITLHVVPQGAVHVELTWRENYGDLDLHYLGPGGTLDEISPDQGDLFWNYSQASAVGSNVTRTPNANPDWGRNNTVAADGNGSDDASLDVDQQWGYGPENITHPHPFDGTYQMLVHYYFATPNSSPNGTNAGPATATVRVWINGVLWLTPPPSATLTAYQVWEAGTVTVSNNGADISVAWSNSAPHADTTGAQNCQNAH